MINLLIQWISWNYALGHCLLMWWKTFLVLAGLKTKSGKPFEKSTGVNMSIKVHFLHSLLDKFPDNYSNVNDEQREWFCQDIGTMKERYQGRWDILMMAVYYWSIERGFNNSEHDRQSRKRKFLSLFLFSQRFYFCCLLNDLIKILGIFNCVIFKDIGSDCYCKNTIFQ